MGDGRFVSASNWTAGSVRMEIWRNRRDMKISDHLAVGVRIFCRLELLVIVVELTAPINREAFDFGFQFQRRSRRDR